MNIAFVIAEGFVEDSNIAGFGPFSSLKQVDNLHFRGNMSKSWVMVVDSFQVGIGRCTWVVAIVIENCLDGSNNSHS